ncbi:MAG: acyltransferase family protein [Rhodospirillales bacterium]
MKYRAEIDGLRALAVVPVMFFHAGIASFSGGYIGVDVFFVISGYLITTIIIQDLETGRFSLANFYERRARRILPALFFVILVSLPFAWMLLTARHLKDFAQSLVAVSAFSSNILFWHESGYFETAAEFKPLLHTWSLAVEEQYYICFPLLLMLIWRFRKPAVTGTMAVLFAGSFALACYAAYQAPAAAFFLLPMRAWELLAGVLCALYLNEDRAPASPVASQLLSALGLLAITVPFFAFDEATPTPSHYTLLPIAGACLIILYANQGTFVRKVLSSAPFVGVGLISYSTYLWHQPILAFAKNALLVDDFERLVVGFVVLSVALGWLSWRFVERPFRQKQRTTRFTVVSLSVLFASLFVGVGYFGHAGNGFPAAAPAGYRIERPLVSADIFLLGDSHAGHLMRGLTAMTSGDVLNRSSFGCIPFLNVDRYDSRFVPGECAKAMNAALQEFSASKQWGTLVMSAMGPVYLDGSTFRGKAEERVIGQGVELIGNPEIGNPWDVYETGMRNTFAWLSGLEHKRVIFMIDVPELGIDQGCNRGKKKLELFGVTIGDLVTNDKAVECKIPRAEYEARGGRYKALVKRVAAEFPKIEVFDPTSLLCDRDFCYGHVEGVGYIYSDPDHLSEAGSHYVAAALSKVLPAKDSAE